MKLNKTERIVELKCGASPTFNLPDLVLTRHPLEAQLLLPSIRNQSLYDNEVTKRRQAEAVKTEQHRCQSTNAPHQPRAPLSDDQEDVHNGPQSFIAPFARH